MATLRETKERIASVRNTLKITSAMKLVASAKLRKAQRAIESLRPYQQALGEILEELCAPVSEGENVISDTPTVAEGGRTAVVCISSNTSLCGAFNANIIRKTLSVIDSCEETPVLYAIGHKMNDALRRAGYAVESDCSSFLQHGSYEEVESLACHLFELHNAGSLGRVILVYTGFVSVSRHELRVEQYLPYVQGDVISDGEQGTYIVEPSAATLVSQLRPQVLALRLYAAVLDSLAAEQAARTVAMQTASDNAENLLSELTLEYNKCRQQKITAEILDLAGGMIEE